MQSIVLLFLTAVVAVALAGGQYYVPRAYYTIDAEGHASAPVPLRRLRRSLSPYPFFYHPGYDKTATANANANAHAQSNGGRANANANANASAQARSSRWGLEGLGSYGAVNPAGLSSRQSGRVFGARTVSASSTVNVDDTGNGYYDQVASVA